MTTQATPDIPERVSRLEGAYEQVTERLRDLTESLQGLRSEMRAEINSVRSELHAEIGNLKTTIIVIGVPSGRPPWAASSRSSLPTDAPDRRPCPSLSFL